MATALLKSFVSVGVFSDDRRLLFLRSFNTVTGEFIKDKCDFINGKISQEALIQRYGHLRPGTYELDVPAYWENPMSYLFSKLDNAVETECLSEFCFELTQEEKDKMQQILKEMDSQLSANELMDYFRESIQAREFIKFEFTKNLSHALDLCIQWGNESGMTRSDLSFLEYRDLELLKLNAISNEALSSLVELRKRNYALTTLIELPSLIVKESDFYGYEKKASQPNFITMSKVEACIHILKEDLIATNSPVNIKEYLSGKIVLISQADPGFDWLFGYGIVGLITKYGGANSHMAIRAAEIDLPAAIGVGEKMYEQIASMNRLYLDCANHIIREI